ncbi:MAG: hypothetical protein ABRQ35_10675, partial [Smithellaceae bacterium]
AARQMEDSFGEFTAETFAGLERCAVALISVVEKNKEEMPCHTGTGLKWADRKKFWRLTAAGYAG